MHATLSDFEEAWDFLKKHLAKEANTKVFPLGWVNMLKNMCCLKNMS